MKSVYELAFWKGLLNNLGEEGFLELRRKDFENKTKWFGDFYKQGTGLDLGSGLISIFEFAPTKNVIACDPLMDEYDKLLKKHITLTPIVYVKSEDDKLPFATGSFDWVFCTNVIDHTPDPDALVEEIYRVLKPHGKLYFEVNFDDQLGQEHYSLWNEAKVDMTFNKFRRVRCEKIRNEPDKQYWYYSIFIK